MYKAVKNLVHRNQKGFTLVELMIVIATIGILGLVLIPKSDSMKTAAKSVGIDTNMRMVQAIVQTQIGNYAGLGSGTANGANETAFQTNIINILNPTDTAQRIKDPFNNWTGAAALASSGNIGVGTVAVVDTAAGSTSPPNAPNGGTSAAGVIYVDIYSSSNTSGSDIYVTLTPYDSNGNAILIKQVTIKP